MTKLFILVFGGLTVLAIYLTTYHIGVTEPSLTEHSVRQGSVHGGVAGFGYRRGK